MLNRENLISMEDTMRNKTSVVLKFRFLLAFTILLALLSGCTKDQKPESQKEQASLHEKSELLSNNKPLSHADLGAKYYYRGKFDEAISELTKAIESDPSETSNYIMRGWAYSYKNEYDKASA